MIRLSFEVSNPWQGSESRTLDYLWRDWDLTTNKNLEIQISRWTNLCELFKFDLDLRWRGRDHAGPSLEITFLSLFFCIRLYDHRHWNYNENRWELPGENYLEEWDVR